MKFLAIRTLDGVFLGILFAISFILSVLFVVNRVVLEMAGYDPLAMRPHEHVDRVLFNYMLTPYYLVMVLLAAWGLWRVYCNVALPKWFFVLLILVYGYGCYQMWMLSFIYLMPSMIYFSIRLVKP